MVRRTLVIALFVLVVLACAAPLAAAYQPVFTATAFPHSTWAPGADPAVLVSPSLDGTRLLAQYWPTNEAMGPQRTVASGISALSGWYAVGDGTRVTVLWKDGATVWATCIDVSDGSAVFGPVAVCTDSAVSALEGDATGAQLSGAAPDGSGGAYVWCTATPTRGVTGFGDTLLNHISPAGALAVADPGLAVAKGTVSSLAADDEGHAFVLLAPPGRNSIATQRLGATLAPDTGWTNPISPYSPLVQPPVATKTPLAITAGAGATIAWREGAKVKVQRYPAAGGVIWLSPPGVIMTGAVKLASDGLGGAFLAGPSGPGVVTGHVLSSGATTTRTLGGLSLADPVVGGLVTNRAGDLFVGYGDGAPGSAGAGVGLLTWTGSFTAVGSDTMRPDSYSSGLGDGIGGAYFAGDTTGAGYLLRVGGPIGFDITFRPRALTVDYGKKVAAGGYVYEDALAMGGATVNVTTPTGTAGTAPAPVQSAADGYYSVTLAPKASATWTASTAKGQSQSVRIEVQPKVTMTLSHLKASTRLSEILSGSVTPNHAGKKVLAQKAVGKSWKTVASGKLDSRSRYRITWYLPYKTATYKLRVVLPAHADHAQGTSPTGTLRVKIRRG